MPNSSAPKVHQSGISKKDDTATKKIRLDWGDSLNRNK